MSAPPKLALVLSGGGARAAYQAGVLQALAERRARDSASPFRIVCGTSAGAINAAAIAAGAQNFGAATARLRKLWSGLSTGDIYRSDSWHIARTGARWFISFIPGFKRRRPPSLLDNTPLTAFLEHAVPFDGVREALDAGVLDAFGVTAMSYRSGLSVTFCTARPGIELWERAQRVGIAADVGVAHLVASAAIPFVFPPAAIDGEFFGDGAVRQVAPTAPALHLGADRILVIGAARSSVRPALAEGTAAPSIAEIGGQVMASIFTDALGTDLEKVRLINAAVRQIEPGQLAKSPVPLRDVELLVLTPSIALEEIALAHSGELPRAMRMLLGSVGGTGAGGAGLLSYLLFEPGYCRALIELGYKDAAQKAAELDAFFAGA